MSCRFETKLASVHPSAAVAATQPPPIQGSPGLILPPSADVVVVSTGSETGQTQMTEGKDPE